MSIQKNSPTTARSMAYLVAPISLAIATFVTYYPSLFYAFQFDDIPNIQKFFASRSNTFLKLFNSGSRWISYWLNAVNYRLGKLDPFFYRFFNVMFHIITGVFIFFVTYQLLQRIAQQRPHYQFYHRYALAIAYITSLMFLLHPVQTQTVSYVIQGQLEGLAGLCIMGIILGFLAMVNTRSTALRYFYGVITCFIGFISCGTKEIAILSPILLLLVDWFFVAQADLKKLTQRTFFYALFTAIIVGQYIYLLKFTFLKTQLVGSLALNNNVGNVLTDTIQQKITRWPYFISQFKVILHYLWIFIWPTGLSVDYDWKMARTLLSAECILPLAALLSLAGTAIALWIKDRTNIIAFGIFWFFIGIAPRSSFIPSTELIADYKTYFSGFGWLLVLTILLVWMYDTLLQHIKPNHAVSTYLPYVLIITGAGILGYVTYERNKVWRSSEEFWWNIIQNAPLKARGYNNYAVSIAEKKRHAEAIPFFRKALRMDPIYPDAWSNLAVCFNELNQVDMAIMQLEQAIRINPTYPEFYNNLSSFYLSKKQYDRTIELATHAIALRPHYGKAFFNRGRALYEKGQKEEACKDFKTACIEADFDTIEAFTVYAQCALELGKYEEALQGYRALCMQNPHNPDCLFNLANAYYFSQRYDEAITHYQHLVERFPTEYRGWFNMAEALIQQGKTAQALECFKRAQPLAHENEAIAQRIKQFVN